MERLVRSASEEETLRQEAHEHQKPHLLPTNHYLQALYKVTKNNTEAARRNPSFHRSMTLTQQGAIELDQELNELAPEARVSHFITIDKWYRSLGSMNTMEGASSALAHAGVLLQREQEFRRCRPNKRERLKLLIPTLFFEAGLATEGVPRQQHFEEAAWWLERHYTDEEDYINPRTNAALRLSNDLKFQIIFDRAEGRRRSEEWLEEDKRLFREMQSFDAEDFLEFLDQVHDVIKREGLNGSKSGGLKACMVGWANEWWNILTHRQHQIITGKEAESTIRNAFVREQFPEIVDGGRKPKHSIDAVITRYTDGKPQTSSRYKQYKSGVDSKFDYVRGVSMQFTKMDKERSELEDIDIEQTDIANDDKFLGFVYDVAKAVIVYNSQSTPAGVPDIIQKACRLSDLPLDTRSLAA